MRGCVLNFSIQENIGYISGNDGNRYSFFGREWKDQNPPRGGDEVDFVVETDQPNLALNIYKIVSQSTVNQNETTFTIQAYEQQLEVESRYLLFSWFMKCMRNYVNFSGRARRKEFWSFYFISTSIQLIPCVVLGFFVGYNLNKYRAYSFDYYGRLDDFDPSVYLWIVILLIIILALSFIFVIPMIAVTVRRLHDIGLSGWWALLMIFPNVLSLTFDYFGVIIGLLVILGIYLLFFIWMCTDTKPQPNQWGLPARRMTGL